MAVLEISHGKYFSLIHISFQLILFISYHLLSHPT